MDKVTITFLADDFNPSKQKEIIDILEQYGSNIDMTMRDSNEDEKLPNQKKYHLVGMIVNLILDMSVKGATDNEMNMAYRYLNVVLKVDVTLKDSSEAYENNNIRELRQKYEQHNPKKED